MTYNDSYHTALGCTPSEVHLGRRLGMIPITSTLPEGDYSQLGFAERLDYILAKTQSYVARQANKLRRNEEISSKIGAGRVPTIFKKDDKVLLYKPVVHPDTPYKISPHWFGPYTIDKVGHQNKVYYLKDSYGVPLKLPVSILRLKEYIQRENEEIPTEKFLDEIIHQANEYDLEIDLNNQNDPSEPSDDEPLIDMEWNNPNEEFVPLHNPPVDMSQEELQVLKSINSDTTIKARSERSKLKTQKFTIPRANSISGSKKRIVRKFN